MSIVIIKYNAGNVYSVENAFHRIGVEPVITADKEVIKKADKVIFPGVGEASSTMNHLRETGLDELIKNLKQPVLGICVGMQMLCKHSEEGNADCLGIFDTVVKRFLPQRHEDKIPHMGWNTITNVSSQLFDPSLENQYVYYVHSYYAELSSETIATTDYVLPFSAALHKDNFYGSQFHIEKSGSVGEKILKNFLEIK